MSSVTFFIDFLDLEFHFVMLGFLSLYSFSVSIIVLKKSLSI